MIWLLVGWSLGRAAARRDEKPEHQAEAERRFWAFVLFGLLWFFIWLPLASGWLFWRAVLEATGSRLVAWFPTMAMVTVGWVSLLVLGPGFWYCYLLTCGIVALCLAWAVQRRRVMI